MYNFSFEPLKLKLATNNIIIPMENGVADLTNAETSAKIMLGGKELFPDFDESIGGRNLIVVKDILIRSVINNDNGDVTPSANDYRVSGWIGVTISDYTLSINHTMNIYWPSIAYYDQDKNFIRKEAIQSSFKTITISINDPNIKFIRIQQHMVNSSWGNTIDLWKLEKGTVATPWTPAPEDILKFATLTFYNCSAAIVGDLVKITSHKPGTARGWVDVTVNYGNLSNTKRLNWSVEGVEPYKPSGTLLTMNNRGIKL